MGTMIDEAGVEVFLPEHFTDVEVQREYLTAIRNAVVDELASIPTAGDRAVCEKMAVIDIHPDGEPILIILAASKPCGMAFAPSDEPGNLPLLVWMWADEVWQAKPATNTVAVAKAMLQFIAEKQRAGQNAREMLVKALASALLGSGPEVEVLEVCDNPECSIHGGKTPLTPEDLDLPNNRMTRRLVDQAYRRVVKDQPQA
jgi:hypothetical protein